jgi:uncharacterized cupredoxin-like copper-binding protein
MERDRNGFGIGALVFMFMAMVLAFASLVVAAQAWSRSNDAKDAVTKLAEGGVVASKGTVRLEEFKIIPLPSQYKAGTVTLAVKNVGTMTHEMVLLRAPSADALPKVTQAGGDRAVGDVDEEAIAEADKMGETGDVKPGATVVKSFKLTPGHYVMICNIDDKQADGTVISHFQRGMSATITVE